MADTRDLQDGKNFYLDVTQKCPAFSLKGSNSLDREMKNRLPEKALDLYHSLKSMEERTKYAK